MVLRTAVVGAGIVSRNNHLPALARNPRTDLVAVCDLERDAAREAAAEYDCAAFVDPDRLLETETLDWLHVATPVQTHADLTVAALEAGVPVLVQKPAATTVAELERMRAAAADAGVPFSVVNNWLYYPVVRTVRRRIGAGEIGDVRAVEVTVAGEGAPDETYRGDWVLDLAGGDLEEGLPHPIYLALGLGGVPRSDEAIDVRTRTADEYDDVDYDGASIQYVSVDDALCSISVLSGSARDNRVRVYGTEGSLHVDVPTMTVDRHDADSGPYHFQNERNRRHLEKLRTALAAAETEAVRYARARLEDALERHTEESQDGHYYLLNEAAKAIEHGERPPVSPEVSRWTLDIIERIREAASAGPESVSGPASSAVSNGGDRP
ncbi:Gfo/Idh/MocA family protein [Natrinema sp. 74]|uniref:Gfo/Idh/MocA family protein n=1 Tax=Natrinema sp. 74 TaxID=3384159 RepID=UPI0038D43ECC